MITAPDMLFLTAAGGVAGVIGTAGGITSLVSYPALLAVGLSPLAANVTNAVSLVGSGVGSSLGSRVELAGQQRMLRRWAPVAMAGGLTGAFLLLVTPAGVFNWIVPFLIATASVLLLLQPRITARRGEQPHGHAHADARRCSWCRATAATSAQGQAFSSCRRCCCWSTRALPAPTR